MMTNTKLLLAGLLAGTVALGTGCKTDKSTTNTSTDQMAPMTPDAGMGGAGIDTEREEVEPLPQEGTREMEPDVHDDPLDEPGTGGTGFEPEPLDDTDENLGGEPLDPAEEGMMNDDERTTEPQR